ncbi:MAG: ABC transporter permease [Cytophagales bacterium]|nr:ABC transporter permease [Cytophagales bacterium]
MFRSYLTIALRTLWRNKIQSSINILGLSLGVLCCLLITLYVHDEWSFDTFHTKVDRIYRVYATEDWGENQQFASATTPFPMGPALKDNFPEVVSQVRVNTIGSQVKVGDQTFSEQVTLGGQDFFDVFDFSLETGNRPTALRSQNAVVLSKQTAIKYFGTANPMDKVISIQLGERYEDFLVKGVSRVPTNSSITFGILISDLNYPRLYPEQVLTSAWFNINPETYVLLGPGVDPKALEAKFPSVFRTILGEEEYTKSKYSPGLQPMASIHLDNSYPSGNAPVGNPKYSYILAAIALLILVVACINFVTLSVGQSIYRSKEVGIRKVVGAARKQLIVQFIGESVVLTIISVLIGLAAARISLPVFNELAGKQLELPMNLFVVGTLFALLAIIGVVTGSYPAFILSALRPLTIMKGALPSMGRQRLRSVLVGVQLVLSIFLISSTLIMRQQLRFLQDKNLGFNKEQLAVVQLNVVRGLRLGERIKQGFEQVEQFKAELAKYPSLDGVCGSAHDFGNGSWTSIGYTDDLGVYRNFDMNVIDDDYVPTLKMEVVNGRNFSDDNLSDKRRSVLVNEAFVKEYGWTDPIGKRIPGKGFDDHEIIGVIKDFNYNSLYTRVTPLVMVENPSVILSGTENINIGNSPVPKLLVRIKAGATAEGIDQLKAAWEKISGKEEFAFSFVDQALDKQYRSDQNLGRIVTLATLLSILIGSMGLYALASLSMQNRTKEISIRKVMGATEQSLLVLLTRDYVGLILISLMLSVPMTFLTMQRWLLSFEYRIGIDWKTFLVAGGISMVIALVSIGYQTLKTAWTEPAETLRSE